MNPIGVSWSVAPSAGGDAVDQERGREGPRDASREPAPAEGVEEEEREDLVGRHESAPPVENSETVRVPVLRDREVAPLFDDAGGRRLEVLRDGLRVDAAEERVPLGAHRDDARSPRPEDFRHQARGRAVHRVGENGEPGRPDRVEPDERRQVGAVRGQEIDPFDAGPSRRRGGRPLPPRAPRPRTAPAVRSSPGRS